MNRFTIPFLFFSFFILGLLPGCNDWEDNYSTRPNDLLSFSTDTITFDTVFTTIGSTTKQFKIYNRNSSPLLISSISLQASSPTGFRINVDGRSGDSFSDISISQKDSLFILVEITVDPTDKNNPFLIEDSIVFLTNGVKQHVILQAYGQDAHIIKGGYTFEKDTLLSSLRPYLIYDSIMIAEGVQVEIEQGATFYMYDKAKWKISGTMHASGTQEAPVTFRGHRLDDILEGLLAYDQAPGQWGGITFKPESYNNRMEYVIVRSMTNGLLFEESDPGELKLSIQNSQITNAYNDLFHAINCRIEASNSEFTNAGGGVMILAGGDYEFIHCTLANHIKLVTRDSVCLTLSNNIPAENKSLKELPLTRASFFNSIIDGSYSAGNDSLGGEMITYALPQIPFQYEFDHCVVKTKKITNPAFTNVQFGESPDYKLTGERDDKYRFDFRLKNPDSRNVAIGNADPSIAERYPYDRYGIYRFSTETGPDIGAYQYLIETGEESSE